MTPIDPTKPRKAELSDYSAQDIHDLIWARIKGASNIYELLTQRPIYRLNSDAWLTKNVGILKGALVDNDTKRLCLSTRSPLARLGAIP